MEYPKLVLKIDVDTEVGTRVGVPNLMAILKELEIPATFYLSLGPDNTGRAIKRIFRKGFLKKVTRTSVVSTYGIRTLLNGVLLPGPHIGRKHTELLRSIKQQGFEVGIHAYDHEKWQDGVTKMSQDEIQTELLKATAEFQRIFGEPCKTTAAPGWQANAKTLAALDNANIIYASDCRGKYPFYPRVGTQAFKVLQIPTTLPTLDELLGRPEFPLEKLEAHYLSLLDNTALNVFNLHPEIEGMNYKEWFRSFLIALKKRQVQFKTFGNVAFELQNSKIATCELIQGTIDGRSGNLAVQAA